MTDEHRQTLHNLIHRAGRISVEVQPLRSGGLRHPKGAHHRDWRIYAAWAADALRAHGADPHTMTVHHGSSWNLDPAELAGATATRARKAHAHAQARPPAPAAVALASADSDASPGTLIGFRTQRTPDSGLWHVVADAGSLPASA